MDGDLARSEEEWGNVRGGLDPNRKITEHWYARMGYKTFRRGVPRYPETTDDGGQKLLKAVVSVWATSLGDAATDLLCLAQYMRKEIAPSS